MFLNILGTKYKIAKKKYNDEPYFKEQNVLGWCNSIAKEIVYLDTKTHEIYAEEPDMVRELVEQETLRHEIIHAFLNESGLQDCSFTSETGWAKNEEMVDWIALQFPKILEAYKKVGCI